MCDWVFLVTRLITVLAKVMVILPYLLCTLVRWRWWKYTRSQSTLTPGGKETTQAIKSDMDGRCCLCYYFLCPHLSHRRPSSLPACCCRRDAEKCWIGDFYLILPLPSLFQNPLSDHLLPLLLLLPLSIIPLFLACTSALVSVLSSAPLHRPIPAVWPLKDRKGGRNGSRKERKAVWGLMRNSKPCVY